MNPLCRFCFLLLLFFGKCNLVWASGWVPYSQPATGADELASAHVYHFAMDSLHRVLISSSHGAFFWDGQWAKKLNSASATSFAFSAVHPNGQAFFLSFSGKMFVRQADSLRHIYSFPASEGYPMAFELVGQELLVCFYKRVYASHNEGKNWHIKKDLGKVMHRNFTGLCKLGNDGVVVLENKKCLVILQNNKRQIIPLPDTAFNEYRLANGGQQLLLCAKAQGKLRLWAWNSQMGWQKLLHNDVLGYCYQPGSFGGIAGVYSSLGLELTDGSTLLPGKSTSAGLFLGQGMWLIGTLGYGMHIWNSGKKQFRFPKHTRVNRFATLPQGGLAYATQEGWLGCISPNGELMWQTFSGGAQDVEFLRLSDDGNYLLCAQGVFSVASGAKIRQIYLGKQAVLTPSGALFSSPVSGTVLLAGPTAGPWAGFVARAPKLLKNATLLSPQKARLMAALSDSLFCFASEDSVVILRTDGKRWSWNMLADSIYVRHRKLFCRQGNQCQQWNGHSWQNAQPQVAPAWLHAIEDGTLLQQQPSAGSETFFGRVSLQNRLLIPSKGFGLNGFSVQYQSGFVSGGLPVAWRLLPHQTSWKALDSSNGKLVFAQLWPRNYQLEFKIGNVVCLTENINPGRPWWLRVWAWLSLALFSLSVGMAVYMVAKRRSQQKIMQKKALVHSRLVALKSQMKPHFIFNVFNSIQAYMLAQETDLALEAVQHYAQFIRKVLEQTDQELISIQEEIETLSHYLELERLRYGEQFSYRFNVPDSVMNQEVHLPPMLLQPLVENAIFHGLFHKQGNKFLEISFTKKTDKLLEITVEDNGIGRKAAQNNKRPGQKSFASQALAQRLQLLNATYATKNCKLEYEDKYNPETGEATGTLARICLFLNPDD